MDKLRAMATFVAIVDNGSLTSAAEQLDRSSSAVVRTLAELEKLLGVRLLNRSTRQLSLTDEGRDYLMHCRHILQEVDNIEHLLESRRASPAGKLRITAPVMFGRLHLAPLLNQWLMDNPGMNAELTLLDRTVDLIEEGFDLALRIGQLADSSMVAKPLGVVRTQLVASPDFIQTHGRLNHPDQLAELPVLAFAPEGRQWRFEAFGESLYVRVQPVLVSNQIDSLLEAAKRGLGIARVISYQSQADIQSGELVSLLEDYLPEDIPVQFLYPHSRLLSPRVRGFLEVLSPKLTALLS